MSTATAGNERAKMRAMATRRPWRTPRLPDVVSSKGACELLRVDKQTLWRWCQPGSGSLGPDKTYMIPPKLVWSGDDTKGWPIWDRADVERFAAEIGRQRAPAGQAQQ